MAKSPDRKTPPTANDDRAAPKRRSPLTDFLDASEPLHRGGFAEMSQPELSGTPLAGSIADWAEQIEQEAEKEGRLISPLEGEGVGGGSARHKEASNPVEPTPPGGSAVTLPSKGRESAKSKKIPERSSSPGRSARGTSMGGAATARERTAAGLNPVAGLDISLEDAETMASGSVTATVAALSALIESGNPLHKDGVLWTPHRPARPEKSEGGIAIKMVSDFEPAGDQPTAIKDLVEGVDNNDRTQVLLGVTGSGKTFTMAKVIEETQRPALILAPNKTLAAQLYSEFKKFFPENAVEYFVSYYDYYQPEAYVPRTDTFIEKESSINEQIDRMRHSATRSLLERDDVIIVASVSCIYGIGSVETYTAMTFQMQIGDRLDQRALLADLVAQQYKRQDINFVRGSFRVRGDTIEIFPAHLEDRAWRISMFGDEIEQITEFDPLTGQKTGELKSVKIYANSHYVTPRPTLNQAIKSIKEELKHRLVELERAGRLLEAQRLEQRCRFDLEMLEATGSCAGIENYSRYLTGRQPGDPPPTLFEYIPDNALVFIDESHVTVPQIGGMYRGDFRRKATLAEYGFRLPSCMDNRPLRFEEWDAMRPLSVAVSATPGGWEMEQAGGVFAEQVIRPTGLIDPPVEVRPAKSQVDDVVGEIRDTTKAGYRTLVTVLTKRMAEDLTEYLHEQGVRVRYMHSDIDTLERIEILRDLRLGAFDVLVGINLLREGLDIPECGFVAILDADKEGFLRSETSLIQTIGRAARNVDGKVILYADQVTGSMERAMAETNRRREKQVEWNAANGITPESVKSRISDILDSVYEKDHVRADISQFTDSAGAMMGNNLKAHLDAMDKQMRDAAANLDFEKAARIRDEIKRLREMELSVSEDPLAKYADMESPVSGREKGKHNKGVAKHRTSEEQERFRKLDEARAAEEAAKAARPNLFRKPDLDEMGADGAVPVKKPLFSKPSIDDMGPGTDMPTPAGAVSRSLFKKQSAEEAHGSDFGIPGEPVRPLFKKNSLDEMTVRRTETPIEGDKPVKRERAGIGSYEDPGDARREKRRPGKTGRPGR
ncbi:excinuclease ABC subunit UvrB [Mesorhizobium sp.]|uniref:excinuclease ABC subunit UvrB n=1 Tax=Mesorhizobium sp. TaxID=1871066 RepID=UPI000FE7D8B6|nr:excinuclease ABC subunit UvrB [Mesorhizobium sp.]RWC55296.1 MAG: excinuclease ABC subunit UvrB [Mesorhizobium sp.]RWC63135.1 MAG: excinuclease ABC subunit UvrB [Mesorhizobium sp.]